MSAGAPRAAGQVFIGGNKTWGSVGVGAELADIYLAFAPSGPATAKRWKALTMKCIFLHKRHNNPWRREHIPAHATPQFFSIVEAIFAYQHLNAILRIKLLSKPFTKSQISRETSFSMAMFAKELNQWTVSCARVAIWHLAQPTHLVCEWRCWPCCDKNSRVINFNCLHICYHISCPLHAALQCNGHHTCHNSSYNSSFVLPILAKIVLDAKCSFDKS